MTDIIRKTAVFIRANTDTAESRQAAAALADMIDGRISADEALAILSDCLGCELQQLLWYSPQEKCTEPSKAETRHLPVISQMCFRLCPIRNI